jgi:hypothetical protein
MAPPNITIQATPIISRRFQQEVTDELRKQFNEKLRPQKARIQDLVRLDFASVIEKSATYKSLLGGLLRTHFGFDQPLIDKLKDLPTVISGFLLADYQNNPPLFEVSLGNNLYETLIGEYQYISINTAGEQHEVPWMEWLLTAGINYPIPEYAIVEGSYPEIKNKTTGKIIRIASRSGNAIMIKRFRKKASYTAWHVPIRFAGTENANFITKAFVEAQGQIIKTIERELASIDL